LRPLAALRALVRVNANVVKPGDFHKFLNAAIELGIFRAAINQPRTGSAKKVL
jgi:hypothetical protein